MWTISELKTNAKSILKGFYWKGVLVCLIAGLLTGTLNRSSLSTIAKNPLNDPKSEYEDIFENFEDYFEQDENGNYKFSTTSGTFTAPAQTQAITAASAAEKTAAPITARSDYDYRGFFAAFMGVMIVIIIIAMVIGSLYTIFVGNVITVGKINYFMESRYRGGSVGIVDGLFAPFTGGRYSNTMKTMFIYYIKLLGWSLPPVSSRVMNTLWCPIS